MSKPTEVMSQHDGKDKDLNDLDILEGQIAIPGDEEFGGTEARKRLEKKLLRKLDARMSILIIIYILNYVSGFLAGTLFLRKFLITRLTVTMLRKGFTLDQSCSLKIAIGLRGLKG